MTVYELKRKHEQNWPTSPFFSRDTMKHWGDTMRGFTTPKRVLVLDTHGQQLECWELRRKQPRTGNSCPWFFACDNFRRVHGWEVQA